MFSSDSVLHQLFVTMVICGMIAGTTASIAPLPNVCLSFNLCAAVPITIKFLTLGGGIYYAIAGFEVLYVSALVFASRQGYLQFAKLLSTRLRLEDSITELEELRSTAVAENEESKDLLRATFDNFPGGVSIYGEDMTLLAANARYYELNRVTPEDMPIGSNIEDMMRFGVKTQAGPDVDIEAATQKAIELFRENAHRATVFQRPVPGTDKFIEMRTFPRPAGGYVSVHMDITERKAAERDLKEKTKSAQLLERVAIAANMASTVEDALQTCLDEVCLYTNWPVGHAYMVAEDGTGELVPANLWHLCDLERLETFRRVTADTRFARGVGPPGRVLESGKPIWIEDVTKDDNFFRGKDVDEIGVRGAFAFPVLTGEEVVAVLEFFSSELEEPNERTLSILAAVGAQIGRVIERQRVQRTKAAERAAAEGSRAKSEFFATMSHEIRTPMNGVLGMINLMLDTELTPKQQHYAERIKQSGDALLGLINRILDLAKIEAGHTVIEQTDFHLPKLLDEATTLFDSQCSEKGIRFRLSVAPDLPMVLNGDHGRIRQVLFNLIGNAVKFTEHGSIAVAVDQEDVDGEGLILRIKVKDSGIGIPLSVQDSLFEKFTQADASTTREYGGTGLGLAICKELVELMGGSIGLDSAPGQGSTFWFTARCRLGAVAPLTDDDNNADIGDLADLTAQLAKMQLRVLLAEDNPVNQEVTSTVLEAAGVSVDAVGNGFEAVQAVQDFPYDVVLMDIHMPEMDGATATRLVRGLTGRISTLPIIALTADAMDSDKEKHLSAGFDDYLTKPFDPSDLYAVILRHVSPPDESLSLSG